MKNFLEYLNEAEESPKEHRPSRSSTTEQLNVQAQHSDPEVVMAALADPESNYETTRFASKHSDPAVVMAAINHRFAYSETTRNAVEHPDPEVALAGLRHLRGKNDLWTVRIAGEHPDPRVASEARRNPMFDPTLIIPSGEPVRYDKPLNIARDNYERHTH
jgi:hypothetical protein